MPYDWSSSCGAEPSRVLLLLLAMVLVARVPMMRVPRRTVNGREVVVHPAPPVDDERDEEGRGAVAVVAVAVAVG